MESKRQNNTNRNLHKNADFSSFSSKSEDMNKPEEKINKLRKLLFGKEIERINSRFNLLEAAYKHDIQSLKTLIKANQDKTEALIVAQIEKLQQTILDEQKQRTEQENEFRETLENFEKEINARFADLQQYNENFEAEKQALLQQLALNLKKVQKLESDTNAQVENMNSALALSRQNMEEGIDSLIAKIDVLQELTQREMFAEIERIEEHTEKMILEMKTLFRNKSEKEYIAREGFENRIKDSVERLIDRYTKLKEYSKRDLDEVERKLSDDFYETQRIYMKDKDFIFRELNIYRNKISQFETAISAFERLVEKMNKNS